MVGLDPSFLVLMNQLLHDITRLACAAWTSLYHACHTWI